MSLRARTTLSLALITLVVVGGLLLFNRFALSSGFEEAEESEVQLDVERGLQAVNLQAQRMGFDVLDWSSWDDTYEFVQTRNPEYLRSNLTPRILDDLDIDAWVLFDTSGRIVEARSRLGDGSDPIPEFAGAPLSQPVLNLMGAASRLQDSGAGGILRVGDDVMMAYARPVLTSLGRGPSRGTLFFGRVIDDERVAALSLVLATPVETLTLDQAPMALVEGGSTLVAKEDGQMVGYGVLRDRDGQPVLAFRTKQVRAMTALANRTTYVVIGAAALSGLLAAGGTLVMLELTVLRPMSRLRRELAAIGNSTDGRVTTQGNDEIAEVAREANRMLARLEAAAAERVRLSGAVREQQDLAATALEAMSEGLLAFDGQGRCTVCNAAAARLLGTTEVGARGRNIYDLLPGLETAQPGDQQGPLLLDIAGRTLAITRGANTSGSVRHASVVLRDVTGVLDVERLRRDVISTVSHELRTPLTAIQATVELLDAQQPASKRTEVEENLVSLLIRNVARLRRILDDLLTLSSLEGASVQLARDSVDIGVLASRVVEDLRPVALASGVNLRCETAGPAIASVDEARLRQVLENLLGNAVKFSREGGNVVVAVRGGAGSVTVAVADQGAGIPPAELDRVFERFFRSASAPRTAQGTGLGLPIAKMIVELHGGRIWLESDGRNGTTAFVTLPPAA